MTSFRLMSQASMHVPRNFPEPNLYHPYFRNTKLHESKLVHSQFSIHCLSLGMGMRLEVEPSSQLYNFLHMTCCATPPPTHTHLTEDQQFNDEKSYLIKQIKEMQPTAVSEGATP